MAPASFTPAGLKFDTSVTFRHFGCVGETSGQKSDKPSEAELRAMLEAREQVQASAQSRLAGIGTRILAISFAVLAIGFFSFRDNREAVASMFLEAASDPQPPSPATKPADAQESVEDLLLRTSNGIDAKSLGSTEGKVITKEDIAFATELLNFGQTPSPRKEPPAEKAKDR